MHGARGALRELVERYALACDERDAGAVTALFAEDAVLVATTGERRGRAEIREAFRAAFEQDQPTLHSVGGQVVEVGEDGRAQGTTWGVAYLGDRTLGVRYHDEYVLDGDTWRFARRRVEVVF